MADVVVHRWTRFGVDRAYVRVDDLQVGYRDLHSGVVVCNHSEHAVIIEHVSKQD